MGDAGWSNPALTSLPLWWVKRARRPPSPMPGCCASGQPLLTLMLFTMVVNADVRVACVWVHVCGCMCVHVWVHVCAFVGTCACVRQVPELEW